MRRGRLNNTILVNQCCLRRGRMKNKKSTIKSLSFFLFFFFWLIINLIMADQPSKYHLHNQWNYDRRSRLQEQSEPSLTFLVRFSHILIVSKWLYHMKYFMTLVIWGIYLCLRSWLSFNFNKWDMLFQIYLRLMTFVFMKIVVRWISYSQI